jgi:hypothetical protein
MAFKSNLELTKKVENFSYLGIVDPLNDKTINSAIVSRVEGF